ncbi:ABC transporter permease [soil metagenome]
MNPLTFAKNQAGVFAALTIEHLYVVALAVIMATVIGVLIGVLTYRSPLARNLAMRSAGVILTIPSFALFGVFLGWFSLTLWSSLLPLVLYGLLPIIRNTVVGLTEVDDAVVESAKGMGMTHRQRLTKIELRLATPVILTGIRVTTTLLIGILAIAAIINGPGLGNPIMDALARVGTPIAIPEGVIATVLIVLVAILLDVLFAVITRFATPKGLR